MAESVVIQVEPASVEITPGGSPVTLTVRVVNATSIVDSFTVGAVGGEGWLVTTPVEVRLLPGAQTTATVRISIPADRFATAGPRVLSVRAVSAADSRVQETVQVSLVVREVSGGLSVRLDPQVVSASKDAHLLVRVRNPGNAPVTLKLSAQEAKGLSSFAFQPQELTIPPRYESASAVAVATKRPMFGAEESRPFTIRADDHRTSLSAAGTLTVRPVISQRLLTFAKMAAGLLVALAIAGVAFASAANKVDVPKVTGKSEAEARQAIEAAGFVVEITSSTDDSVPAGIVIEQTPASGQKAKKGSVVDLTVSLGAKQVEVPNVVGLTQGDAAVALQNVNLRASPGQRQPSDQPAGTVIDQNPKAGQSVPEDSAVTLVVSAGAEQVVVPDLSEQTRAVAEKALKDAGFLVEVTEEFSDEVPADLVIGQTPAASSPAAKGSTVTLVVSMGPEPFEMPNVVGLTREAATQTLESLGLVVTVSTTFSTTSGVVGQVPDAGGTVRKGDTVQIIVGRLVLRK